MKRSALSDLGLQSARKESFSALQTQMLVTVYTTADHWTLP
jgi:hypothetical protein